MMTQPKKLKRHEERTHARNRTISARKSAGTKRPRNHPEATPYHDGGFNDYNFNAPPMNLKLKDRNRPTLDIDTLFGSSAFHRTLSGRAPLARKYT